MIDAETWVILGRRLEQIRVARAALAEGEQEDVRLEFDANDQATVRR